MTYKYMLPDGSLIETKNLMLNVDDHVEVLTTQGVYALVDREDVPKIAIHRWYAATHGLTHYIATTLHSPKKHKLYLHRYLMGIDGVKGIETDHVDGNGWNNRRSNMRIATRSQNMFNKHRDKRGASQYVGVYWAESKWCAQIRVDGKTKHVGLFADEQEAARARDAAVLEQATNLDFIRLNFPEEVAA